MHYFQYFCLLIALLCLIPHYLPYFIYLLLHSEAYSKGDCPPQTSLCHRKEGVRVSEWESQEPVASLKEQKQQERRQETKERNHHDYWAHHWVDLHVYTGILGTHSIWLPGKSSLLCLQQNSCRRPFGRSHCYSVTLPFESWRPISSPCTAHSGELEHRDRLWALSKRKTSLQDASDSICSQLSFLLQHISINLHVLFIFTAHWIQLILPACTQVCNHLPEQRQSTSGVYLSSGYLPEGGGGSDSSSPVAISYQ